jgi:hypothetical protein
MSRDVMTADEAMVSIARSLDRLCNYFDPPDVDAPEPLPKGEQKRTAEGFVARPLYSAHTQGGRAMEVVRLAVGSYIVMEMKEAFQDGVRRGRDDERADAQKREREGK